MKARVTCNQKNLLGQEFGHFFDCTYMSRSTGFDITQVPDRRHFLESTSQYDWTINITNGGDFSASSLLCELESYCYVNQLDHKVFNIGSYICLAMIDAPTSKYPAEKAALKFSHRKIAYSYAYHQGYLDSYLLSLNFIKGMSDVIEREYTHLNTLSLDSINQNIKYILENPNIKEMCLQYKQPGNHRINNGVGPVLPAMF